jgi:hypothetical protein
VGNIKKEILPPNAFGERERTKCVLFSNMSAFNLKYLFKVKIG